MPKRKPPTVPQNYPRIEDQSDKFYGYLDDAKLQEHTRKISLQDLRQIILDAIQIANVKSSRKLLNIPEDASPSEVDKLYKKNAKQLFDYFRTSYTDPASSAHQYLNRHFSDVAKDQFRGRTTQSERMNSGWRYQYIAKDTALRAGRFESASDVGTKEADFNAVIKVKDSQSKITIYVSVKNRSDTIGGQDMPKAIQAMEDVAKNDQNRIGSYICVFGIAMQRGKRRISKNRLTGESYSVNTEMWLSDFFWPFFSNYSYQEIVDSVLDVLIETQKPDDLDIEIPPELILYFGDHCRAYNLVDENGKFNDAHALVRFFCGV